MTQTTTTNHQTAATSILALAMLLGVTLAAPAHADDLWVTYPGGEGPGKGKHIVLVSGDEEYRSEEALPQLGKILSKHHGFKCTVLFAINPKTGEINPDQSDNIPGLEALKTADLMIVALRFRNLKDEQMQHIVDYIEAGKPIVGLRTSTHAFNIPGNRKFHKYSWRYGGDDFKQGFGKQILGETWVAHHGAHKREATRGIIAEGAKDSPLTRGIKDGDIFGPTDVYTVRLPLPGDSKPIIMGQVVAGMKFDDPPVEGKKNNPMMPVTWTKTFNGARVFTTTMGSADDLIYEGTRRMIVNGVYWAVGMEDQIPKGGTKVDTVGDFNPTKYGFRIFKKGTKPSDYK